MNPRTSMVALALGVIAAATLPAGSALANTTPEPTPAATSTLTTSPPPTPIKATTAPDATQKPGHPAAEPVPLSEILAGGYRLQNRRTGRCLDSYHDGSVYTLSCNGGLHQKWYKQTTFVYQNAASGRCLDSNHEGHVYALACHWGHHQEWFYYSGSSAGPGILKNAATGRCLDSNFNGNVYTLECNSGSYQDWYITSA